MADARGLRSVDIAVGPPWWHAPRGRVAGAVPSVRSQRAHLDRSRGRSDRGGCAHDARNAFKAQAFCRTAPVAPRQQVLATAGYCLPNTVQAVPLGKADHASTAIREATQRTGTVPEDLVAVIRPRPPFASVDSTCAPTLPCAAFGDLGGWTALVRWKIQQVVER
jgi:hypothetical protein